MGNIFRIPECCSNCKQKGNCVWKIIYQNPIITQYNNDHNLIKKMSSDTKDDEEFVDFKTSVSNTLGKIKDDGNLNENFILCGPGSSLDFAIKETLKIEHIIGKIRISQGSEINMIQFFCNSCHDKIRCKLDELPDEWDFEGYYEPNSYYHIELP